MRDTAPLSDDLLWRVIYQHNELGYPTEQIAKNLGIRIRTVQRCLARYRATGDVAYKPAHTGRPRILTEDDEAVSGCI